MESPWTLKSDKQELNHDCCFLEAALASPSPRLLNCNTADHTGPLQGLNKLTWAQFPEHCQCLVKKQRRKIRRNVTPHALKSCLWFYCLGFWQASIFPFFLLLLPAVFPVFLHNIAPLPSTPFSFTIHSPLPSSGDLESQREPSRKICPHTLLIFLPVMGWIVSPLKCICCVPTPGTLGCGTYLEIESLQMQLVKMRSYWHRLGSHSKMISIPKSGGVESGHRPVFREDAKCTWRQPSIWQENGLEQRLPSQPAEGTNPDNTVLSDFSPPELWDDTFLLLKASTSSYFVTAAQTNYYTPRWNTSSDFTDHLEFLQL